MRRSLRVAAGALLWGCALVWAAWLVAEGRGPDSSGPGSSASTTSDASASTLSRLLRFFTQRGAEYRVVFPRPVFLQLGDDVELADRVVGRVDALLDAEGRTLAAPYDWTRGARILLHDRSTTLLRAGASARLVQVPQAAAWVLQTLLTKENVPRIATEWNDTMLEHREQIFALVTPIVRDAIIDVERHVEAELPAFLEAHREEVRVLSEKIKEDLGGEKLAEVFEKEIWPIAQPRVRPVIEKVSREVWEKLPLWSLTWRLAYQTLPLTENDLLERAWVGFLEGQALPVFKSHSDEIVEAVRDIAKEALAKEEVTGTIRQVFATLMAEPAFHALCQVFVREVILDNPRFHEAMERRWHSPEVQAALEAASAYVEPMARRMGDILFGTREAGITTEFARVLRSQILLKDLQRIVLDPGPEGAPPLPEGAALGAAIESELKR